MKADEAKLERLNGWILAGMLFVHLALLRPGTGIMAAVCLVLFGGAILRARMAYVPRWLGRLLLIAGVLAVVLAQSGLRPGGLAAELAAMTGALLLLRAVSPNRGLRILFCILVVLAAVVVRPYETVGAAFVVLDVVVLLLMAEQIHRPAELAVSFWASLLRSLRVVVPVGIVVSTIFWLFPNLSHYSASAFTGFSGSGVLDPGAIADLNQSRRVALVARFADAQPVPPAGALYWRGQVLEINEGLRWSGPAGRKEQGNTLRSEAPASETSVWRYSQEILSNRGGIVPVLDHAVYVEATRAGQDVAVIDIGAAVLRAVGTGPLSLDVASVAERPADAPLAEVAEGNIGVPSGVRTNAAIAEIARRVISPSQTTTENLAVLAAYFRKSGFTYSMRSGRTADLARFLLTQRRGFCEHYAAAAANILRLGGVPARIVTGYRGGEWNPWRRTITVRDSDAHAWIEVWDQPSARWLRFDPSAHVAVDLNARIAQEMNSDLWPWYRTAFSYGSAVLAYADERWEENVARVTSSEAWEYVQPVLSGLLALAGAVWLVRNHLRRRTATVPQAAIRLLDELERRAVRVRRQRLSGETPLAWLERLRCAAGTVEGAALGEFATCYEAAVYGAGGGVVSADLRTSARRLRQIWKSSPIAGAGGRANADYTPIHA